MIIAGFNSPLEVWWKHIKEELINSAWNGMGKDSEHREFELSLENEQDFRTENKEE